jgi:hypothetical protein
MLGNLEMSSGAWEELSFLFNDFPTLKLVQPEIGSNLWKRNTHLVVFVGPSMTIENMENRVSSMPDHTHICLGFSMSTRLAILMR